MAITELDAKKKDYLAMLIYSRTGGGKTHFSATLGNEKKTCFVNSEKKMATLNKFAPFNGKILGIDTLSDLVAILTKIQNGETTDKYEALVVDSITRAQLLGSINVMKSRSELADKMVYDDWNRLNVQMNQFATLLPFGKMHIVCTAMAVLNEIKIEESNPEKIYQPSLTGQFSDSAGGWFNIVAYLETKYVYSKKKPKEIVRRLHFEPGEGFEAKVEFGNFPNYIDNPTFGDILKLLGGEKLNREVDLIKDRDVEIDEKNQEQEPNKKGDT